MENWPGRSMDLICKFLLVAGWTVVASPLAHGQTDPPPTTGSASPASLTFDVATIKPSKSTSGGMGLARSSPDSISLVHVTASSLIANSYEIKENLIIGGPAWVQSSEYDIEAKVVATGATGSPELNQYQINVMVRALLADRFKLALHPEIKQLPIYELTLTKSGPKLRVARPGDTYPHGLEAPEGVPPAGLMLVEEGKFTGQAIPLSGLIETLSLELQRTVIDKTGLTGKYDITLQFPREGIRGGRLEDGSSSAASAGAETSEQSLFTMIEQQLGLRLVSAKGPVKTLVIDRIDLPSAN